MATRISKSRLNHIQSKITGVSELFPKDKSRYIKIYPHTVIFGAFNTNEAGISTLNSIPNDFGSFGRIYDGKEAVLAPWDNSEVPIQDNLEDPNDAYRQLQVGDYFEGILINDSLTQSFAPSSANSNFLAQQIVKSFTIRIPRNRTTNVKFFDKFSSNVWKLYKSPSLYEQFDESGNKIPDQQIYVMEISSPIRDIKRNMDFIDVNLVSLNDRLSNTGLAINQYVHFASPGDIWASPLEDGEGNVSLDPAYLAYTPVTHVEVTLLGAVGDFSIKLYGRDLDNSFVAHRDAKYKIYPDKFVFPWVFQSGIHDRVSQKGLPEQVYALTSDCQLSYASYQGWLETFKSFLIGGKLEYEGSFQINKNDTSNPNSYPFWDNRFLKEDSEWPDNIYDTRANTWFNIAAGTNSYGSTNFNWSRVPVNNRGYANWNFFMSLLYDPMYELPSSISSTIKFNSNILGAFLGWWIRYLSGINDFGRVWNIGLYPTFPFTNFLMPKKLLDFYKNAIDWYQGTFTTIPMESFRGEDSEDPIRSFIGANSMTTSKVFNLTDQVSLAVVNFGQAISSGEIRSTMDLGQRDLAVANRGYAVNDLNSYLVQPDFSNYDIKKWAIDIIDIKFVGRADIKLNFYSQQDNRDDALNPNNSIWTGVYKSVSSFTGSSLNIANQFVLGNPNFKFEVPFRYPKSISPPNVRGDSEVINIQWGDEISVSDYNCLNWPTTTGGNFAYNFVSSGYKMPTTPFTEFGTEKLIKIIPLSDYGYDTFDNFKAEYNKITYKLYWTVKNKDAGFYSDREPDLTGTAITAFDTETINITNLDLITQTSDNRFLDWTTIESSVFNLSNRWFNNQGSPDFHNATNITYVLWNYDAGFSDRVSGCSSSGCRQSGALPWYQNDTNRIARFGNQKIAISSPNNLLIDNYCRGQGYINWVIVYHIPTNSLVLRADMSVLAPMCSKNDSTARPKYVTNQNIECFFRWEEITLTPKLNP